MSGRTAASRRDFLRLAGASAPAALAAAAVPKGAEAAEEAPETDGLRRTDHVNKYIDSARF